MFEDYKKILLDFYLVKHKNHRLSINLEDPGREKIRNECVKVFLQKNTQQDRDFIRSVFDPNNQSNDLVRSIEKFDLNKLRPLVSFLTIKDRNIRDEKLVKLLAWLIDFPAYSEWRELGKEELTFIFEEAAKQHNDEGIEDEEDTDEGTNDNGQQESEEEMGEDENDDKLESKEDADENKQDDNHERFYVPRFSIRRIAIASIILLFIESASFVAWENSPTTVRMPNMNEKCMYWDEDHYEPVKCNAQIAGATVIPLDLKMLKQQRKINIPDTMTTYSLGKVWYKGHGKDHEFFTFSGVYPGDTSRVLKPLSDNVRIKYTSNYRYLFTRLAWFLCAAFFISLCGIWASRLKKEVKSEDQFQENDITETLPVSETNEVMNEAELKVVKV